MREEKGKIRSKGGEEAERRMERDRRKNGDRIRRREEVQVRQRRKRK